MVIFLSKYQKGAKAERELIHFLYSQGFAISRSAGSGTISLPAPDVIALKKDRKLAFECKFWSAQYLNITNTQMKELLFWRETAGIDLFIGWKIPRKGWRFLTPEQFKKNPKGFLISQKKALRKGLLLNVVTGMQKTIKN